MREVVRSSEMFRNAGGWLTSSHGQILKARVFSPNTVHLADQINDSASGRFANLPIHGFLRGSGGGSLASNPYRFVLSGQYRVSSPNAVHLVDQIIDSLEIVSAIMRPREIVNTTTRSRKQKRRSMDYSLRRPPQPFDATYGGTADGGNRTQDRSPSHTHALRAVKTTLSSRKEILSETYFASPWKVLQCR
jgi:hypothetical protein